MKISELSKATNTNVETVRFYEKIGLLAPPARLRNNYRSYGETHLGRLRFVRRARQLGLALDEVRELLTLSDDSDQSCAQVDAIANAHLRQIEARIVDLEAMANELRRLVGQCEQGNVGQCRIIESLAHG